LAAFKRIGFAFGSSFYDEQLLASDAADWFNLLVPDSSMKLAIIMNQPSWSIQLPGCITQRTQLFLMYSRVQNL
jgi:hypothetical protein